MKRITAFIRPHRLDAVKTALADLGANGFTVTEVRGTGNSNETPLIFGNREVTASLPLRAKLMVVVHDEQVEEMILGMLLHAKTGEPGDGKIFIEPIEDAIRVRTNERGESAV